MKKRQFSHTSLVVLELDSSIIFRLQNHPRVGISCLFLDSYFFPSIMPPASPVGIRPPFLSGGRGSHTDFLPGGTRPKTRAMRSRRGDAGDCWPLWFKGVGCQHRSIWGQGLEADSGEKEFIKVERRCEDAVMGGIPHFICMSPQLYGE